MGRMREVGEAATPALELVEGDLTQQDTDAIVNAANASLLGGGGVDGAIHQAGGPAIVEACRSLRQERYPDGLPTGCAVATTGGALRARWVIHTVGPVYATSIDPARELASCYAASLAVADEIGARSVSFPAISTGVFGYPMYEAARVALRTVRSSDTRVERVRFALFGAGAHAVFVEALGILQHEEKVTPIAQQAATRGAWKNLPLPEARSRLPYQRQFDARESERLRVGLHPLQMEDKWFIYLEDDWLYFHRSWTGFCIYAVRLSAVGRSRRVVEAWVSRDADQYVSGDDRRDSEILGYLVERLLLGRNVPFPGGPLAASYPVVRHDMVGPARANDEG
jgi:O-acetyl-ADP-ribose deacetylase (regulator of RNase III)